MSRSGIVDGTRVLRKRRTDEWADALMRERETVYRYAYSRVGPNQADEVLSTTLAAAWRSRRSYQGKSADDLRAWLLGIATNMIRQQWDAERRWIALQAQVARERDEAPDPYLGSDSRLHAEQTRAQLIALLDTLDPVDRDLLILNVVHDLDYAALSTALGIPIGTAKSRLSRAKASLRNRAHSIDPAGARHG
jgi:RNA polymerase sigma-70 factor (ECF subfamily)